jgi:SET family sugar efflux transporter-like MFS transporter
MLISVSWVAGPPVAAALVALTGFGGLFVATAVFYAVIALITLWLPELGSAPTKSDRHPVKPGLRAEVVYASAAFTLAQGSVALSVMAIPLFVTTELNGTTSDAGLILGLCAALEIPLMIAFGALAMKMDLHRLVCFGAAFALAYHALVLVSSSVWQMAALQLIHALVISAVMGVGISYFQTLAPDRPGHASTLFSNTNTAGAMLAGPLLGVAQQFGFRTAYAMSLAMSVIALVFLILARPKHQSAIAT